MGLQDSPFAASGVSSATSTGGAGQHPKTRTKNEGFFANLANAAASAGSRALNALDDEKHDDVSTATSSTHDTPVGRQRGGNLVGTHFVASLGGDGGGGGLAAGLARIRRVNSGGAIDSAKREMAKEEAANNTNISARRFSESAAAQSAQMLQDMLNDDWSDDSDDDEDMLHDHGGLDGSNHQYFGSSSKPGTTSTNALLQKQEEELKSAADSFRSSRSNGRYTYSPPTGEDSNRSLHSVGLNSNTNAQHLSSSNRSSPVSAASSVASDRRRSRRSKSSWGKNQPLRKPQAPPSSSSSTMRGAEVSSRPSVPVNEVRNACTLSIEIVGPHSTNVDPSDIFGGGLPGTQHQLNRRRSSVLVVNDMQASTLEAEAQQAVQDAEQATKDDCGDEAAKNKKQTGHLASGPLLAEIRRVLNLAYGSAPNRHVVEDFAVVPAQGDGCAICILRAAPNHPTKEFTAVWLAARLLVWSSQHGKDEAYENMLLGREGVYDPNAPAINLRCGINSGEVRVVRDVYGDPSVVGESIDLSCRICDSAQPNQILASSSTVIPKLVRSTIGNIVSGIRSLMTTRRRSSNSVGKGGDDDDKTYHGDNSGVRYTVDVIPNEIIVGMNQGATSLVQSITCSVEQVKLIGSVSHGDLQALMEATEETPRVQVGNNAKPLTKWYMKIKPTELAEDETTGMKSKVPPTDLIQRHLSIAFVGVNHDRLAQVFSRVIDQDESLRWERVYILFLTDSCIESLHVATNGNEPEAEADIRKKNKSRIQLEAVLSGRVNDLRFYEYDQPFFCGSFWDWDERGGFIHVSPLVWGCSPKRCPAINYFWQERMPSADYQSYRDGLNGLLKMARPFDL